MDIARTDQRPISEAALNTLRDIWYEMESLCADQGLPEITEDDLGLALDMNFDDIESDHARLEDSALAFDRLVSFQDKLENMEASLQAFLNHNVTLAAMAVGVVGGSLAAMYMASQGQLEPLGHKDLSFIDLIKEHPVFIGGTLGGVAAGAAYEMTKRLGRGYAAIHQLQEAHDRLLEGADPKGKLIEHRLTPTEREAYRGIITQAYSVLHTQDHSQTRAYIDKLQSGISALVKKHQGAPDAHSIEHILNDIEARLSDAANEQTAVSAPGSSPTAPGMA